MTSGVDDDRTKFTYRNQSKWKERNKGDEKRETKKFKWEKQSRWKEINKGDGKKEKNWRKVLKESGTSKVSLYKVSHCTLKLLF